MNWDEKIEQKAREIYPDPGTARAEYPLAATRQGKRSAYVLGARWQRDRLRTDEAVERVAVSLLHSDWPSDEGDREYHWKHFADSYRDKARAAIDALIGEES